MSAQRAFYPILCFLSASIAAIAPVWPDGGYFSEAQSVAVSTDQRAILIKDGDQVSVTLTTGYTGEGQDFAWIIPTPVTPSIANVAEAGENGTSAFRFLEAYTAPKVRKLASSCFPSGTEVLTASGPRAIETILPGTTVHSYDPSTGEWALRSVLKRHAHHYEGDMVSIHIDADVITATANHPFYVLQGKYLDVRPLPADVPGAERRIDGEGRWVEARNLKIGDLLLSRSGNGLTVTELSTRRASLEVYNLEVESYHTYTVSHEGVLVHNKGSSEVPKTASLAPAVTLYGSSILDHYSVTILGAESSGALLQWLTHNGYRTPPGAQRTLNSYIDHHWSFVAVKLNPSEKRHYENELLPPLTIKYQHDRLVFPLRISSVSTTGTARIGLYVIAASTVSSSNFATRSLSYENGVYEPISPSIYVESRIRATCNATLDSRAPPQAAGRRQSIFGRAWDLITGKKDGGGLAVTWSGELPTSADERRTLEHLFGTSFPEDKRMYLTRLEARMNPREMTDDLSFVPDPQPRELSVNMTFVGRWWSSAEAADVDDEVTDLMYEALEEHGTGRLFSLLRMGADVNAKDILGVTALMYAARFNRNPEVIAALVNAGAEVSAANVSGWTPVFYGARNPVPEVLSELLKAGAALDQQDRSGQSALMHVAEEGRTDSVRTLLKLGAGANTTDQVGRTALMLAAREGHTDIVRLLVQASANVNAQTTGGSSPSGITALMMAAERGHVGVMNALIEDGAEVDARDQDGETALIRIADMNDFSRLPEHASVASLLLAAGADKEARDKWGRHTPLMAAAYRGNTQLVRLLLQAGANIHARDKWGDYTALMDAAGEGHAEVVRILLDAGADVNAHHSVGWTALMFAAREGSEEVVRMLIAAGADINARTNRGGHTALSESVSTRHFRIAELLRTAGAVE